MPRSPALVDSLEYLWLACVCFSDRERISRTTLLIFEKFCARVSFLFISLLFRETFHAT